MPRSALLLAAATVLMCTAAHAAPAPAAAPAQASPGKSAMSANSPADVPACPGDRAVWVNPRSKAYHLQGDPMFGHTKRGKYECEAAAKAAGDHPVKAK